MPKSSFPMSHLRDAVVTFEVARGGEKRRYRVVAQAREVEVRELMPQHVEEFGVSMLLDIERWSAPFLEPSPILSIALRGFAKLVRPSGDYRVEWLSAWDETMTVVDLGTFEMDAVKARAATEAT